MIRSMTGFGRAERTSERRKIAVEMKSVNNRYLDFNIRMPRKFSFLDAKIRQVLKEYMVRGKVDVFINCETYGEESGTLKYNPALAAEYVRWYREIGSSFGIGPDFTIRDIASSPEVLMLEDSEMDEDELWSMLEEVLREAASHFRDSRILEGGKLREDLSGKLDRLYELALEVEEREPEILKEYRAKLEEKLAEVLENHELDEARIAQEVVLFADRISTDEETVRLKSHISQMRKELDGDAGVGRKLDFLAQEMNREANTTLSKAGDLRTSDIGIEMKTEIEKIREQIQNIE